ncbi:MAG: hypothetical protein QOG04_1320 [Actinomycetota bacterium]|jgi:hypothetical protein|nr:hypothetical protein [Actinomycetota bacterium]
MSGMRRIGAGLATLSLLVLMSPSLTGSAAAAERGTIEGRVLNESTNEPQPGVRLTLTSGTESDLGEVVATATSDSRGRYRFTGLTTGADRYYALDARFDGGLFAGRPIALPSDTKQVPVIDSTLRVWNTTSDPAVIAIRRDDLFVVTNKDGIGVIESITVLNTSHDAYIGRGAEMLGDEATGASFSFGLPRGAEWGGILDSTLDIPDVVQIDQGVAATIAIPPGENQATFAYRMTGTGGSFDLSRPALYPTLELSIYAAAPLEIRSNRLVEKEDLELEGKTYGRWTADEPIDAGDPLQALAVAGGKVPIWPLVGAGALVILLLGGATWFVRRTKPGAATPPDRARLLEEVAGLDLAYEAGEIEKHEWDKERAALVGRIRELQRSGR